MELTNFYLASFYAFIWAYYTKDNKFQVQIYHWAFGINIKIPGWKYRLNMFKYQDTFNIYIYLHTYIVGKKMWVIF